MYKGVYNGVVWLPTSPEQVHKRFSYSNDTLVEISLFGIANLDDVRRGKHKPIMERRGPYVFQKKRTRANVEWTDDGETVMFIQGDEYTFVESASVGSLNDTIVTLNIPLVGVVETILHRYPSGKVSEMLQMVAHTVESWGDEGVSGIFMRRQIGELLFGYTDHLLSLLSHIVPGIESTFSLLDGHGQQSFKVKTGKTMLEELGDIISWQGVHDIKAWAEPEPVAGTDGRQFPPSIRESSMDDIYNTTRRVWVAEAFRSFEMVPSHDTHVGAVKVVRLIPSEQSFKASRKYYQKYDGLFNITSPMNADITGDSSGGGPRLFLSLPGFCRVDPPVSRTVEGMACSSDKGGDPHIYLDVEPTSGITVHARKSLLLSSWFGKSYNILEPRINREAFVPVMEVVEHSIADNQSLSTLKSLQNGVWVSHMFLHHAYFWSTLCMLCGSSIVLSYFAVMCGHRLRVDTKYTL